MKPQANMNHVPIVVGGVDHETVVAVVVAIMRDGLTVVGVAGGLDGLVFGSRVESWLRRGALSAASSSSSSAKNIFSNISRLLWSF